MVAAQWRYWVKSALLLSGGILVGLLLTLHTGAAASTQPPSRAGGGELSAAHVLELRTRQQRLKQDLSQARTDQASLQLAATSNQSNLEEIRASIDDQKMLAGLTPLRGPGVVVVVDDSSSLPPDAVDANRYIIHQQQLVTLVGVLWGSGAEAIAINDQRITDRTSIYCVGSTVMVNQEFLAPPFTIRAIGDPTRLEDGALHSPLLADMWLRQRDYGLEVSVKTKTQIQVPAYTGPTGNNTLEIGR